MVRRILLLILLAALLPLCALAQTAQVVDPSDVLSDEEEVEIARLIGQIEAEYPVDLVVLVTFSVPDDDEAFSAVYAYADDFYDQGGYGVGEDRSGMIYLIDLNNGVQHVSNYGEMVGVLDDERLDAVLDAAHPFLVQGDWGRGTLEALWCVWACLGEYAADCDQSQAEAVPQLEESPAGMLLMGGECL